MSQLESNPRHWDLEINKEKLFKKTTQMDESRNGEGINTQIDDTPYTPISTTWSWESDQLKNAVHFCQFRWRSVYLAKNLEESSIPAETGYFFFVVVVRTRW